MKYWIYSGKRPSESAKLLSKFPNFSRLYPLTNIKPEGIIINWGVTLNINKIYNCKILNRPEAVKLAVNKLHTFKTLSDAKISVVPWTTDKEIAKTWLESGKTVIARKVLTGHEGDGIIVIEKVDELIEAPLYTQYIFKIKEFRLHATKFEVFDTQQKVKDPNRQVNSWKVRSYKNGFIFQRKNIQYNSKRNQLAVNTIRALGLDFGALDIIEDKHGNFYILEVNTAPGIEGSTVGLYVDILQDLANPTGIRNLNLGWF